MIAHRGRGTAEGAALTLAGRSVIRAGFALPRDAGRRPALQAVRAASSVGGTCRDGSHPDGWGMRRRGPAGRCADRRSAFPCLPGHLSQWGPRRDGSHFGGWGMRRRGPAGRCAGPHREDCPEVGVPSRPRACSPSAVRGTHAGRMERHRYWFRAPARCRSETGAPVVLALVLRLRCAALTLAGWSVIGTGFALPRDAGRRPALQSSPRLFSVCGRRHPPWRDGASSARVSRSRAMPVGDRRSWRFPACSAKRRPADLAAGLLGGTFAESRTPVGERTALPADRRRWKSPAAESRSRWSRWSRCSCRSSRG